MNKEKKLAKILKSKLSFKKGLTASEMIRDCNKPVLLISGQKTGTHLIYAMLDELGMIRQDKKARDY